MPMKRSGRSVDAASRVIEIDEVLEATMASGFSTAQTSWKILRLTSSFSTAVSITISQSARPSIVSAETIRSSACLRASSVMIFLVTWRDRLPLMVAIADFRRSSDTSLSTTSKPASAATCAMPLPIWPEPITPTFLIIAILSSHRSDARIPRLPIPYNTGRSRLTRLFKLSLLSELAERFGQFGNRLVEIRDQTVIGNLENRRILVLVDRDDHLGILHAGEMLDRAGDADGDIKFRRHHLAGLPDLPVVRRISGIDRGARGADAGAELVGERLDIFGKILAALHGAATGDDDLGRCQFGAIALGNLLADKTGETGVGRRRGIFYRRAAAVSCRGEGRGAYGDDLLGVLRFNRLNGVAGIDRPLKGIRRNHLDDFRHLHHIEQRCDPRHDVLETRRRRCDESVIAGGQRHDQRGQRLGEVMGIGIAFGEQNFRDAGELGRRLGGSLGAFAAAGDQHMDLGAQLRGRGQRLVGGVLQG